MFSTLYDTYFSLSMHFKMSSAISFNLDQSKIFSSGNGLKKKKAFAQEVLQVSSWKTLNCLTLF